MPHPPTADATTHHDDAAHPDGTSAGPVTPGVRPDPAARASLRVLLRKPTLLLPVAVAALLHTLGGAVTDVMHAWTVPTLLADGVLVFADRSPAATLTTVVLGLLTALAAGVAVSVVVLRTGALLLGVRSGVVATLREVRRRWPLAVGVAVVALLVVVLVAALAAALAVLGSVVRGLAVVVLVVLAVKAVTRYGGTYVAALLHGTDLRSAGRRVADLRRHEDAEAQRTRGTTLLLGAVASAVGLVRGARWAVDGLAAPWADAVLGGVQAVVGTVAVTLATVALTLVHVRATSLGEQQGEAVLGWDAVGRVAPEGAGDVRVGPGPGPRRRALALVAVVGTWALVPLVAAAPATVNPTPALTPRSLDLSYVTRAPSLVGLPDGVAVLSLQRDDERLTTCSTDDGCVTDDARRPEGFRHVLAVADQDGAGVAVLGVAWGPDGTGTGHELVTCRPADCAHPTRWTSRAALTSEPVGGSHRRALAARDGAYAVVHPAADAPEDHLALTMCPTASCTTPTTLPLGPSTDLDPSVGLAPDGSAWVLRSYGSRVLLSVARPGDAAVTDVQVVGRGQGDPPGAADQGPRGDVLELGLHDDGSPVVLHQDPTADALTLVTCGDARCTRTTSATLPRVVEGDAGLALDASGRPLVAAVSDAGVVLHACRDRACSGVRSGLMTTRQPWGDYDSGPRGFLTLDGRDRPTVLVRGDWDEGVVVRCPEPRCGL